MDSLLANYASSDEEEEQQPQRKATALPFKSIELSSSSSSSTRVSSLFSSIPQPKQISKTTHGANKGNSSEPSYLTKSSSLFSSLPQPIQTPNIPFSSVNKDETSKPSFKPNPPSIASSLPPPKSGNPQQTIPKASSLEPKPKRVVQFKPPINFPQVKHSRSSDDDDDDEDEEKERKRRKQMEFSGQNSSVKSFLSNFLPAPKNSSSLGVAPSLGSGRRSIVETEVPESNLASSGVDSGSNIEQIAVDDSSYESSHNPYAENYAHYESGADQQSLNYGSHGVDHVNYSTDQYSTNFTDYGAYENHDQGIGVGGDTSGYGIQYGNNWEGGSASRTAPEAVGMFPSTARGRRGKNDFPKDIVEIKQDELMKNRPREDQAKSTGIAFGPSYQPASTKGKPSKLHKRKHQITSLYFDMKQNEMELAERRSRGFLTKAETQAKYGW